MVRTEFPPKLGEVGSSHEALGIAETPKLTPEQLFTNPDSLGLTEFGSKLYGTLIVIGSIKDPNMTSSRISEVNEEIDQRCKEIGIKRGDLDFLEEQMRVLRKQREELIIKKFPLLDPNKKLNF